MEKLIKYFSKSLYEMSEDPVHKQILYGENLSPEQFRCMLITSNCFYDNTETFLESNIKDSLDSRAKHSQKGLEAHLAHLEIISKGINVGIELFKIQKNKNISSFRKKLRLLKYNLKYDKLVRQYFKSKKIAIDSITTSNDRLMEKIIPILTYLQKQANQ